MRWANKIMTNNPDQSQSKLSNRSLSKFTKVNLQKSEAEILSNEHLEKSVLKLMSVQKIKPSNLNHSFISNYVAPSQAQSQRSSRQQFTQNQFFETGKFKQVIHNSQSSKSVQIQYPKILDFGSQVNDLPTQGQGFFDKKAHQTVNQQRRKSGIIQMQNPQNLTHQQRLKKVLIKFQEAMVQFKEVSQSIKKGIKQAVSSGFTRLQNQLMTCAKQFEVNLETGIQHMVKFISKDTRRSSRFKNENLVNTNQNYPPSPSNDSFYKIRNFQHQQAQNQAQKQPLKSRPNTFKNQFKQMIDDSNNENFLTKNQVEANPQQKSNKKLVRKQTNPVHRVNSLVSKDSNRINEDSLSNANDKSMSSIRYSRAKDRSASKSVQKLQEKLVLIKNIFNGNPSGSSVVNEEVKILVQNNS